MPPTSTVKVAWQECIGPLRQLPFWWSPLVGWEPHRDRQHYGNILDRRADHLDRTAMANLEG